ncbi:MAG TPA: DUF4337 domain-containing protein [Candidatus Acidoferrales bacterium]|nr:DUF4337 domain-containing protein [Candidatus Acidoferrales bacterium]
MHEGYSTREAVHHAEHTHHALLESGNEKLRYVPVVAAILAVLAGLSGILAGRIGAQVLSLRNAGLLHEVNASDAWNEYQAESLKAHLYEISSLTSAPTARASLEAQARKYRAEQPAIMAQAKSEEHARDSTLAQSTVLEGRRSNLEVSLAFFEVAIVLTSIAAMIRRPALFWLSAVVGAVGLFFGLRGTIGF